MKSMMFGFAAVNAGQRNVSVEPQVIATSTEGGFRLTAPATRAEEVVAFCEEQGLELGSPEALIAIHKAYDMWAVAKGIEEFDSKGNHKDAQERLTKKDKVKFVTAHFDEMYDAAMQSENQEAIDALTREDITRDEQVEILTQFVIGKSIVKVKGSKTANAAGLTGTGLTLNFTDSNVWKQLKADLHDDADKVNRVYELDLDNVQDVVISNGYEDVTVKALVLGSYTDKAPARSGSEVEE